MALEIFSAKNATIAAPTSPPPRPMQTHRLRPLTPRVAASIIVIIIAIFHLHNMEKISRNVI